MKKNVAITTIAACVVLSVLLFACGTKHVETPKTVECVFPQPPYSEAPLWVCDESVDGLAVGALGYAENSGAGFNSLKREAVSSGQRRLVEHTQTRVSDMIRRYAAVSGIANSEVVADLAASTSARITEQSLSTGRVYKTRTSPTGAVYVLLGLDEAGFQAAVTEALKASIQEAPSRWRQLDENKSADELVRDIANIKG